MNDIPNHTLPRFNSEACDDALFHYTTATGLAGILSSNSMWGTAYYCANDETELATGRGLLSEVFYSTARKLVDDNHPMVETFRSRGVDIYDHAKGMEQWLVGSALSMLCAYITCFYKPSREEDFLHGLLSQWRGYGADGGYAIQFSRKKLLKAIESLDIPETMGYDLQDVHYGHANPLRTAVLDHAEAFSQAFLRELEERAKPIEFSNRSRSSPLQGLFEGPLQSLFDFLVYTKDKHFAEERECRLSFIQAYESFPGELPVQYFNRGGLLVPYLSTPSASFDILECVDWIVIGPGPRMGARFKSVSQLVRQYRPSIDVRPSHIPFTRF